MVAEARVRPKRSRVGTVTGFLEGQFRARGERYVESRLYPLIYGIHGASWPGSCIACESVPILSGPGKLAAVIGLAVG